MEVKARLGGGILSRDVDRFGHRARSGYSYSWQAFIRQGVLLAHQDIAARHPWRGMIMIYAGKNRAVRVYMI